MNGSMKSLLESLLSQIRESGGSNSQGMGSGSFRPMTDQERAQRGIDPRDPNKYSIDDQGRTISTLIGWNPNQGGGSNLWGQGSDREWLGGQRGGRGVVDMMDRYAGGGDAPKDVGQNLAGMLSGGKGPSGSFDNLQNALQAADMAAGQSDTRGAAQEAANQAAGGRRPNFSRPIRNLPSGANLQLVATNQANKAIPKAKPGLQRVSPGMYRDAKGNLVRK